ncbi:MAG: asparagine synthase (glutamine-hydrolyzing) [Longimicrobiales bacterium]
MCGFLGGVFRRPVTPVEEASFRRAIRVLAHRGPDDEDVAVIPEANAILAFRRLSIIDHSTGRQPMGTGAGHHLVFNGEIYNYREVRGALEHDGVPLRTRSDTEVLLWQLAQQGHAGLQPLAGMFAFGFLDLTKQKLLLGRDRLGIKQIYYTETAKGFFFASEPKALLALPWIRGEFAEEQLAAFFSFRAVPSPATLFRGIHRLPAASVLTLDFNQRETAVERYWTYENAENHEDLRVSELMDRFEARFETAIRRRLVADVPVGAFLSGGLDSSLVVAGMRRVGHPDVATFSATFPGSPDDESTFARRVSARFHARHYEHQADPNSFLVELARWVELNDDLVADASCLPLLSVSRMARANGYIVMLSGEGSDELFAGYGSYHKFHMLHALHRALPAPPLRAGALRLLRSLGMLKLQDQPRAYEYLVAGGSYMGTAASLGTAELQQLVPAARAASSALRRAQGHRLGDLCAFDFVTRIPEDLMVRTDRATMGASIEARVPFLDHQLVEFAFSLPSVLRSVPGVSKILPRLLAARWGVPYQTIVHRKIGFQLPLGRWFRNEMRPVWDRILNERLVPGLNYDYAAQLFGLHDRRAGQFEEILWRVAALELWYRRWIEGDLVADFIADEPTTARAAIPA